MTPRKPAAKKPYTRIDADRWATFLLAYRETGNLSAAARAAGISRSTAHAAHRDDKNYPELRKAKRVLADINPPGATPDDQLNPNARRALTDFAYFRRRYFGRVSVPWAVNEANRVAALLDTPHKEFLLVNEPPGVGKSTFYTMDLPAWLIARHRGIRILIGSSAEATARDNVTQLRRELERMDPLEADPVRKAKGLELDAEATLIADFGTFKPPKGEIWTAREFVVSQAGEAKKGKKEPTVRAVGRDTKFLGQRVDLVIWDDLVDERNTRTIEAREDLQAWWGKYAETRLEPSGLLVLQGQRLHSDDLYRFARELEVPDMGDDEDVWAEPSGTRRLYVHVKYKAHYDEKCAGDHDPRTAAAYDPADPDGPGCLLDPKRLTFRDCMAVQAKDHRLWTVTYQQEDVDPDAVLVRAEWVKGGRDPVTQEQHPGCWDHDRTVGVVPKGLTRPVLSIVTADPSPTKFWSVQWWVAHLPTEQRILIDHHRRAMGANDFLDYNPDTRTYTGLLEELWHTSREQGAQISVVVVEQNAAQRFLLQHKFVHDWQRLRSVRIIAHNTYANKTDPQFGVQASLPGHYRYGRVRLPGGDSLSRGRSMALVNEVTRWPEGATDDCVMAHWFLEFNLPRLRVGAEQDKAPAFQVPSWARRGVGIVR